MTPEFTKYISVSCAIIEQNGLVFVAQRSEVMALPLKWELPGGKIKEDESPTACLQREILEELGVHIQITRTLPESTYQYPEFTVTLYPFVCTILKGKIKLSEHADMVWLPPSKLAELDWAEADLPVVDSYCQQLKREA